MSTIVWGKASTGKTTTLAEHAAACLKDPDAHVLFLGFQDRLGDEFLGLIRHHDGDAGRVATMSFQTFCLTIVRQFSQPLGLAHPLALLSVSEELALCLWLTMGRHESPENIRDALGHIRKLKTGMITPAHYLKDPLHTPDRDTVAWLYPAYQRYLKDLSLIDAADLLLYCIQGLQTLPAAAAAVAKAYRHVVIDNAESCTEAQWQLLSLLAHAGVSLLVAVDRPLCPALPHIENWPQTTILETKTPYQQPPAVSIAVQHLMGEAGPIPEVSPISYFMGYDDREESDYISEQILQQRREAKASFHDIGIVYRSHAQCHYLMDSLEKHRIPYIVLGKSISHTETLIGNILGYLRLVENPQHQVALLQVLRQAPFHFSGESLHILRAHMFHHRPEISGAFLTWPDLSERELDMLRMLLSMVQELRTAYAEHHNIKTLLSDIIAMSGYAAMMENDDTLSSIEDLENLDTYIQNLEEDTPLEGLIADTLLATHDQAERSGDVVSLINAKNLLGRRFKTVFICGLEEGLFPHYSAQFDPEIMADEKTYFYRSLTRSTQFLYLTSAFERSLYGQIRAEDVSRWVLGLPKEILTCTLSPKLENHPFKAHLEAYGFVCRIASPAAVMTPTVYAMGTWVTHPLWGEGVIQACSGELDQRMLTIAFSDEVRTLMAKYAPLTPMSQHDASIETPSPQPQTSSQQSRDNEDFPHVG